MVEVAGVEPTMHKGGGFTVHWGYQFSYTSKTLYHIKEHLNQEFTATCFWFRKSLQAVLNILLRLVFFNMVPDVGFELTTYCLQDSCSTTELIRQ